MKTIFIGLFIFFLSLPAYAQEVFMYGEKGEKIYFQEIDSLIQIKFKKDISTNVQQDILKAINSDIDISVSKNNRLVIPIEKGTTTNLDYLKKNNSVVYANLSLLSDDGTIQIPTGKVLVKIKKDYELVEILKKLEIDYDSYKRLGYDRNSYLIALKDGKSLNIANTLYESGYFEYAQPSFTRFIEMMNEFYSDQWGFNNTGQYGGTLGADINAPEALNVTTGCSDIVVALIDQGVDLDHPDLEGNLITGYDATDGGSGGTNGDCWGNDAHGTCCAGIIAAINNTIGVVGVAPDCNIIPIRVTYTSGGLEIWDDDWVVDAINYAWYLADADILSCSWRYSVVAAITNEINFALSLGRNDLGCVVVFAAGNDDNNSVSYPARSNPDIIAVGAMSQCGERKNPSSCDTEDGWGSNYGDELDLVAPGVLIPTTDIQDNNGYNPNLSIHPNVGGDIKSNDYSDEDYTTWFNGTSAATPHVAGVAALVLSINPNLTQDQVRDIIESTCTKVGSYNYSTVAGRSNGTWDDEVGYGCVNAFEALKSVYPITGPSFVCTSGTEFFIENADGAAIDWDQSSNIYRDSPQGSNPCTFSAVGYGNGWISATVNGVELPRVDVFSEYTNLSGRFIERGSYLWKTLYSVNTVQADEVTVEVTEPGVSSFDWSMKNSNGIVYWGTLSDGATMYFNLVTADEVHFEVSYSKGECGEVTNSYHFIKGNRLSLAIAPNPTSGETTLAIKSESKEKDFDEDIEWDMEIYSPMQALKTKKTKLKGKSTTIQTAGWAEGVYTVRVKYKDQVLTGKLIVKR